MANINNLSTQGRHTLESHMAALSAALTRTENKETIITEIRGIQFSPAETMQTGNSQPPTRVLPAQFELTNAAGAIVSEEQRLHVGSTINTIQNQPGAPVGYVQQQISLWSKKPGVDMGSMSEAWIDNQADLDATAQQAQKEKIEGLETDNTAKDKELAKACTELNETKKQYKNVKSRVAELEKQLTKQPIPAEDQSLTPEADAEVLAITTAEGELNEDDENVTSEEGSERGSSQASSRSDSPEPEPLNPEEKQPLKQEDQPDPFHPDGQPFLDPLTDPHSNMLPPPPPDTSPPESPEPPSSDLTPWTDFTPARERTATPERGINALKNIFEQPKTEKEKPPKPLHPDPDKPDETPDSPRAERKKVVLPALTPKKSIVPFKADLKYIIPQSVVKDQQAKFLEKTEGGDETKDSSKKGAPAPRKPAEDKSDKKGSKDGKPDPDTKAKVFFDVEKRGGVHKTKTVEIRIDPKTGEKTTIVKTHERHTLKLETKTKIPGEEQPVDATAVTPEPSSVVIKRILQRQKGVLEGILTTQKQAPEEVATEGAAALIPEPVPVQAPAVTIAEIPRLPSDQQDSAIIEHTNYLLMQLTTYSAEVRALSESAKKPTWQSTKDIKTKVATSLAASADLLAAVENTAHAEPLQRALGAMVRQLEDLSAQARSFGFSPTSTLVTSMGLGHGRVLTREELHVMRGSENVIKILEKALEFIEAKLKEHS